MMSPTALIIKVFSGDGDDGGGGGSGTGREASGLFMGAGKLQPEQRAVKKIVKIRQEREIVFFIRFTPQNKLLNHSSRLLIVIL